MNPPTHPKSLLGRKVVFQGPPKRGRRLVQSDQSVLKANFEPTPPKPKIQTVYSDEFIQENICLQALINGYPQTYTELFYLKHQKFGKISIRKQNLKQISRKLTQAQSFQSLGQFQQSSIILLQIGDSITKFPQVSSHFYQKSSKLAQLSQSWQLLIDISSKLSQSLKLQNKIIQSIHILQKAVQLSFDKLLFESLLPLSESLLSSYQQFPQNTLQFHKKFLKTAKYTQNQDLISKAHLKLGLFFYNSSQFNKAIPSLKKASLNPLTQSQALSKLANTYKHLGETQKAHQCFSELSSSYTPIIEDQTRISLGITKANSSFSQYMSKLGSKANSLFPQQPNNLFKAIKFSVPSGYF